MSYIQFGFSLTESQKQALVEAHKKKTGHTLRLNYSQLLGGDILLHNEIRSPKQRWVVVI